MNPNLGRWTLGLSDQGERETRVVLEEQWGHGNGNYPNGSSTII